MDVDRYRSAVRSVVDGRRVILAGGSAAYWTGTASQLRALGATAVMVVGTEGTGVGPQPSPDDAVVLVEELAEATGMAAIRGSVAALARPSDALVAALRAFDPGGDALAIGSFLNEAPDLDGRPFLNHRRPAWVALEDKCAVDALWDRAGVARAPSAIAPVRADALRRASDQVDAGDGVVWAADARDGWHGGGELVRRVRTRRHAYDALAALAPHADAVRVMPFLRGVPCSIHGIVFPEAVAAVRPIEMVTLGRPDDHPDATQFFYAGCASFYDPPAALRDEMRDVARRVGAALRGEVGFAGCFTVDGVATADGFRPTELNPRLGAGLNVAMRAVPDLPFSIVLDLLVAGLAPEWLDAATLEADLLSVTDAHRAGGTWRALPAAAPADGSLRYDGTRWELVDEADHADGTLIAGSGGGGGFVRLSYAADGGVPTGPSTGPVAAAFWRWADEHLGTAIGPLVPAGGATAPGAR